MKVVLDFPVLGTYSPEDGDFSEGFRDGFKCTGVLTDGEGRPDTIVFEAENSNYVALLVRDYGYGRPMLQLYSREVLSEIENRIIR